MSGEIVNAGRTLEQVTNGILMLSGQLVSNACQIGKLLVEAKEMVGHGGWVEYVEQKISYSQSTANNFMRLYEEYGEFGPNSQTIANFGPTKALALLALPAEQREPFAEEHKNDSVRQLKAEIAKLTRRAEKAEEKVGSAAELMALAAKENGELKQRLHDIDADHKAQLDAVDRENDKLREELTAALKQPAEISEEEREKLRSEGAAKAHSEHAESEAALAGDVRRLKMELQTLGADKDAQIAELKQQLAAAVAPGSNAELVKAETLTVLAEVQAALNRMHGCFLKSQSRAPKLAEAIKSQAGKLIASMQSNFGIEPI